MECMDTYFVDATLAGFPPAKTPPSAVGRRGRCLLVGHGQAAARSWLLFVPDVSATAAPDVELEVTPV